MSALSEQAAPITASVLALASQILSYMLVELPPDPCVADITWYIETKPDEHTLTVHIPKEWKHVENLPNA